jgi:hypothetical protein
VTKLFLPLKTGTYTQMTRRHTFGRQPVSMLAVPIKEQDMFLLGNSTVITSSKVMAQIIQSLSPLSNVFG